MKKYFILIYLNLLLTNNIAEYDIRLYNIPMAHVIINYENIISQNKKAINLKFKTETNKIASSIFKVDNHYETIIDAETFNILSFKKITYQPGLTNEFHTINQNNQIIYNNTNTVIPNDYFNIFSLLYYLTITPFNKIKSNVKLEKEGVLYDCIIEKKEYKNIYEYELNFKLMKKNQHPIIKNTDIFTWAIFKENSYKKISVNKNTNIIEKCEFNFGITSLEAYIIK